MELQDGEKMKNNFLNTFTLIAILFTFITSSVYSSNTYKMTIENIEVLNDTSIQASVYIENIGDSFVLTSYQCALSINQQIDLSSLHLSYIEESSDLVNEPNLFIGVDNIDGPTELTFVSYIGNDVINTKKLVGNFILTGNIEIEQIPLLNIQWDFDGTISTIITGKDFANITDPSSHISIFTNEQEEKDCTKLNVESFEVSADNGDMLAAEMLFDGIDCMTNGGDYNSSSTGRWAVAGFPQWVTVDLGKETRIDSIRLDPFGSDKGISYDCEFYVGDYDNKEFISAATTTTGQQWSVQSFDGVKARYITMVVTGSEGNNWCDFWEMELVGSSSTTDINEEEELAIENNLPNEFGMSQNYPNPFNPTTKIEVSMKESGSARLDVYNILGEKVLSVLDQELSAGIHQVNIDGSALASGIYIYKLDIENRFSQIKKMNLIK